MIHNATLTIGNIDIWAYPWGKVQVDFCEHWRPRSAYASKKADQALHCAHITNTILLKDCQLLLILISLSSWTGWSESTLYRNVDLYLSLWIGYHSVPVCTVQNPVQIHKGCYVIFVSRALDRKNLQQTTMKTLWKTYSNSL